MRTSCFIGLLIPGPRTGPVFLTLLTLCVLLGLRDPWFRCRGTRLGFIGLVRAGPETLHISKTAHGARLCSSHALGPLPYQVHALSLRSTCGRFHLAGRRELPARPTGSLRCQDANMPVRTRSAVKLFGPLLQLTLRDKASCGKSGICRKSDSRTQDQSRGGSERSGLLSEHGNRLQERAYLSCLRHRKTGQAFFDSLARFLDQPLGFFQVLGVSIHLSLRSTVHEV